MHDINEYIVICIRFSYKFLFDVITILNLRKSIENKIYDLWNKYNNLEISYHIPKSIETMGV